MKAKAKRTVDVGSAHESVAEIAARLMVSPEVAAVATKLNAVEQLKLAHHLDCLARQLRRLATENLPDLASLAGQFGDLRPDLLDEHARNLAALAAAFGQLRDSREAQMAPLAAGLIGSGEQN